MSRDNSGKQKSEGVISIDQEDKGRVSKKRSLVSRGRNSEITGSTGGAKRPKKGLKIEEAILKLETSIEEKRSKLAEYSKRIKSLVDQVEAASEAIKELSQARNDLDLDKYQCPLSSFFMLDPKYYFVKKRGLSQAWFTQLADSVYITNEPSLSLAKEEVPEGEELIKATAREVERKAEIDVFWDKIEALLKKYHGEGIIIPGFFHNEASIFPRNQWVSGTTFTEAVESLRDTSFSKLVEKYNVDINGENGFKSALKKWGVHCKNLEARIENLSTELQ
jgi:hypothetical protein